MLYNLSVPRLEIIVVCIQKPTELHLVVLSERDGESYCSIIVMFRRGPLLNAIHTVVQFYFHFAVGKTNQVERNRNILGT